MTHLLRSAHISRRLSSLVFSALLAGLALLGGASACGGTAATTGSAGSGGRGGEGDTAGAGGDSGASMGGAIGACPAELPKAGAPCSGSFSCNFGNQYCCGSNIPGVSVYCRDGRVEINSYECFPSSCGGGAGGTANVAGQSGGGAGGAPHSGGASGSSVNSSEAGQAGANNAAGGQG